MDVITMETITVDAMVHAPVEKVWQYYTEPAHITQWAFADTSWHAPHAENDLRVGGKFVTRMEAKDGSAGFDFEGIYDDVVPHEKIAYSFGDRKATVLFSKEGSDTKVTINFDPETENPIEMQRAGWQAILENFKTYVEKSSALV